LRFSFVHAYDLPQSSLKFKQLVAGSLGLVQSLGTTDGDGRREEMSRVIADF